MKKQSGFFLFAGFMMSIFSLMANSGMHGDAAKAMKLEFLATTFFIGMPPEARSLVSTKPPCIHALLGKDKDGVIWGIVIGHDARGEKEIFRAQMRTNEERNSFLHQARGLGGVRVQWARQIS